MTETERDGRSSESTVQVLGRPGREGALSNRSPKRARRGKARGSRLTRYFLNDRIIPILEERLARGNVAGLQ